MLNIFNMFSYKEKFRKIKDVIRVGIEVVYLCDFFFVLCFE